MSVPALKGEYMSRRDEIIAISEYYNIPLRLAEQRHRNMTENEREEIITWWLSKKED